MPEKRNIYYLQLIVLKCSGTFNPLKSSDPLWQRILYTIWKIHVMTQCIFWEIAVLFLFILDSETLDLYETTMAMAYLMQMFLGNFKMLLVNYTRKTINWLVEETEKAPFYREHDEEFKKNLRVSVAKTTMYTRIYWFFTMCTLTMAALDALHGTIKNASDMKKNCNEKLSIYQERISYTNETMPEILGEPPIYDRVNYIETYIKEHNIFEINQKIVCKKPIKVLPFAVHTPFDHQKYFVLSFIFQWSTYWLYGLYICPLDLMIMSIMVHLKFQFSYIIKDLLCVRADCIKIIKERTGRTDVNKSELIDEKVLADEIKQRLKAIVLHHEHIFKYYFTAEEIFTWVLFAQYFGTSVMMCVSMYQLAFSDFYSFKFLHISCYMAFVIFQLYMNCYYGNDLIIESELVATAAFQSGWEKSGRYSPLLRNHILTIMCRCLRPTRFSAGKFAYISLATFMTIGKSSYSFYTVMSNSKNKLE